MGLHRIPREFHGTPQEIPRDSERLHESPKYFIFVATLVKKIHKVMYSIRFGDIHTMYTKTAF